MSEPNYRALSNKQRKLHYVSVLVERLSGKSSAEIAATLKMTARSVDRDLEYVKMNWSGLFSPANTPAETKSRRSPLLGELMVKAICCACSATIEEAEERVVIAAVELGTDIDDGDANYKRGGVLVAQGSGGIDDSFGKSRFIHCCDKCSLTVREFNISNPAFGKPVDAVLPRARGEEVSVELSTAANPEMMQLAEVAVQPVQTSQPSGEDAQRAQLRAFLNDPKSRGMRQDMRAVAKMWVDGLSQNEVARRLGKDQSTVSRAIAAARNMAYAQK